MLYPVLFFIFVIFLLYLNFFVSKLCFITYKQYREQNNSLCFKDYLLSKKAKVFKTYFAIPALFCLCVILLSISLLGLYELALIFNIVLFTGFFIISILKFSILKEPLVLTDFYLFKEICISPRFYFAYINKKIWFVICIAILLSCVLLSILDYSPIPNNIRLICLFILCFSFLSLFYFVKKSYIEFDALADGFKCSVITSFLIQIKELFKTKALIKKEGINSFIERAKIKQTYKINDDITSHIVLIQAESYCSLHRMGLDKTKSFIDDNETIIKQGLLDIDYLGAYTMRTEFSVLTGLDRKKLNIFAFDPYILCRKYKIESLASKLSNKGYECICIHPNNKKFFSRDVVLKNLGFTKFIGKDELLYLSGDKGYISDADLIIKVKEILKQSSNKKIFIFVITMECHGPYTDKNLKGKDCDLTVYRQKILHFNLALESFVNDTQKDTSLIVYGDHLPSIKSIFESNSELRPDVFSVNTVAFSKNIISTQDIHNLVLKKGGVDA